MNDSNNNASNGADGWQGEQKALYDEATRLFKQGQRNESIAAWSELLARADKAWQKVQVLMSRGYIYSVTGRLDEAIDDANQAIELHPEGADAYVFRGIVYLHKGDTERALADFDRVIATDPDNVDALGNRGNVHLANGDYDIAIADFGRVLNNARDNATLLIANVLINRGAAYSQKGDFDLAIADFGRVIVANYNDTDTADAHVNRGNAHSRMGEIERAFQDYKQAIKRAPENATAHYNLGVLHRQTGDYDNAIACFTHVLKLTPGNAYALAARGTAYVQTAAQYPEEADEHRDAYQAAYADLCAADAAAPHLKVKDVFVYIVHRIEKSGIVHAERPNFLAAFGGLYTEVEKVRDKQFFKPEKGESIAHFTSPEVLKSLFSRKGQFRLYNADYMPDIREGKAFFDVCETAAWFYPKATEAFDLSPAFLGSFSTAKPDRLNMWRAFGKSGGREAAGACLLFGGDRFADKPSHSISAMTPQRPTVTPSSDSAQALKRTTAELPNQNQSVPPQELALYSVVYGAECAAPLILGVDQKLDKLKSILSCDDLPADALKVLKSIVREILDDIRFLFKDDHYEDEKEVRVVQMRYSGVESKPEVEDNESRLPPRLYLSLASGFRCNKVIIGGNTAEPPIAWAHYLKRADEDLEVVPSKIQYRR